MPCKAYIPSRHCDVLLMHQGGGDAYVLQQTLLLLG